MRPSKLLIWLSLALFLAGLCAAVTPLPGSLVILGLLLLLGVALIDVLCGLRPPRLKWTRNYQQRYALAHETEVEGTLENRGRRRHTLRLYDGLPDHCKHDGFPYDLQLGARQHATVQPRLTFTQRGDLRITPAYVETRTPLALWWRASRVGTSQSVQIYPDYVPALNYGLLATADRVQQMGIIKKRSRGVSKEFHQLRDYHEGDALNVIDWKASSRVNRLISREFQEERDQKILLVADCSIRTRAVDTDLPILDHLLNAMILISYMALNQGDQVGIMNFGTRPKDYRYLAPVKGSHGMSKVLNHLYNYQSSTSYGEYQALAQRILATERKRSMIIILTNLRSEDQYGSVEALRLLSQKHLVLLASVQESSITQIIHDPIHTEEQADRYLGAQAYEQDAQHLVAALRDQGISVLRSPLDSFAVTLANHYLDARAGMS